MVPSAIYDAIRFGPRTAGEILREAVLELTYTAHDMAPFARDMGHVDETGAPLPPFRSAKAAKFEMPGLVRRISKRRAGSGSDATSASSSRLRAAVRSSKLAFRGSSISLDGGLLLHRELDDALGLTDMAAELLADPRTGRNGRHRLAGLLRQSIFSRLAGYEDVNDADRLCRDPVMRQLVGGRALEHSAASASAMGRFEASKSQSLPLT